MFTQYAIIVVEKRVVPIHGSTSSLIVIETVWLQHEKGKASAGFSTSASNAYLTQDKEEANALAKVVGGHVVTRLPSAQPKEYWWQT